jgi:hypothetical protein
MSYIIVQAKLKAHAIYHNSKPYECHFVEYRKGDKVIKTARPHADIKLDWVHVDAIAPVIMEAPFSPQ